MGKARQRTHMHKLLSLCEAEASGLAGSEAVVLMHDPLGSRAMRRFPPVEHKHLLHPHQLVAPRSYDRPILPCGLPVAGEGWSVAAASFWVRSLSKTEEVPFSVAFT